MFQSLVDGVQSVSQTFDLPLLGFLRLEEFEAEDVSDREGDATVSVTIATAKGSSKLALPTVNNDYVN